MAHGKLAFGVKPWQALALGLAFFAALLAGMGALAWAALAAVPPIALEVDQVHRRRSVRKQVAALPGGEPR